MGVNHSKNSHKTQSPKSEKRLTSSPDLSDKNLSLEEFVADMIRQLVEQKVEEIVEEERRNNVQQNGSKYDSVYVSNLMLEYFMHI